MFWPYTDIPEDGHVWLKHVGLYDYLLNNLMHQKMTQNFCCYLKVIQRKIVGFLVQWSTQQFYYGGVWQSHLCTQTLLHFLRRSC
jgi:hypothetical protein